MPRPKSLTTRRARYLYDRQLYLDRERRHRDQNWFWSRHPVTGVKSKTGGKWVHIRGPKISQRLVNGKTYNGTFNFPYVPNFGVVILSEVGPRRPPHVALFPGFPHPEPPKWTHYKYALITFHRRGVRTRNKRPRDPRNTKHNRRVAGCNYFYWNNGYFPDDDPLNRRPNETDFLNGDPTDPSGEWPSPGGYV
jgi:hypothetical protein